jgi:hypothetical protein
MFLIIVYIISVITWGIVLVDMINAIYHSFKYQTEAPRLLIPLAIASLALVIESLYFLIANIFRYYVDPVTYANFIEQDNLFLIKIGIAVAGFLIALMLRSERKRKNKG